MKLGNDKPLASNEFEWFLQHVSPGPAIRPLTDTLKNCELSDLV